MSEYAKITPEYMIYKINILRIGIEIWRRQILQCDLLSYLQKTWGA